MAAKLVEKYDAVCKVVPLASSFVPGGNGHGECNGDPSQNFGGCMDRARYRGNWY